MGRSDADRIVEIDALLRRVSQLCAELSGQRSTTFSFKEPESCPARWIRSLLRSRARLSASFEPGLFGDPAFELLLDLYASEEEDRLVSVGAACATSGVPPTTALRWIALLHSHDLVERVADPLDGRRMSLARCVS